MLLMYIAAHINMPRQSADKYIHMPCHIHANKAEAKVLAGLTLNPDIEELSPK
jgi:hypothetical protein